MEQKETKLNVLAKHDFVGYSDFYNGHGHAFADKNLVACIRYSVGVDYNETVNELIDMIINDVNGYEWNIFDDILEDKIIKIKDSEIREALKEEYGNKIFAFPLYKKEFAKELEDSEELPSCIGYIHVFKEVKKC